MSKIQDYSLARAFFKEVAKKWQDYIPYDFIQGIELSPEQVRIVDLMDAQLMVNGSAGSGKSITLLCKMIRTMVQEQESCRILYLSYNHSLIEDARKRAHRSTQYMDNKERHFVNIDTFHHMVYDLLSKLHVNANYIKMEFEQIEKNTDEALRRVASAMHPYIDKDNPKFEGLDVRERLYRTHTPAFIRDEIFWIKANGFITREAYLEAARAGRGSIPRLEKAQRNTIFSIFEQYQQDMKFKYGGQMDLEDYALKLLEVSSRIPDSLKYDYIYVDEVQDLQPMQIKALTKLVKRQLVISGDNKQRIYKTCNHTYEALGLGNLRRRNLMDNFRSTKQIMRLANTIKFNDVENDKESNVRYVREGKEPVIKWFDDRLKYYQYIENRIKSIQVEFPKASIAVIIRNDDSIHTKQKTQLEMYLRSKFSVIQIKEYGKKYSYDEKVKQLIITDPYSVKGLEFDYVFVMDFDCKHYPLKSKIDALETFVTDKGSESESYLREREEIENNEKRILYVAMTRAKKELELLYCTKYEQAMCKFISTDM